MMRPPMQTKELIKALRHQMAVMNNGRCDKLMAQAADALEATLWRDISTAPKDGTEVLLYNGSGLSIGRWEPLEQDCPDQPGHNPGWYGIGLSSDPIMWGRTEEFGFVGPGHLYGEQGQPTQWRALTPPEAE